jgi:hypothetical protein
MRRFLRFSTAFILVGLLASQADARSTAAFSGGTGFFGGVVIGAPHHFARPIIAQHRFIAAQRFRALHLQNRRLHSLTGFPIGGIWPGFWWPNTQVVEVPAAVEETAQPQMQPQIIIIRSDTAAHTVPEPPPDFGYVSGCHAIPNGYHCDTSAH